MSTSKPSGEHRPPLDPTTLLTSPFSFALDLANRSLSLAQTAAIATLSATGAADKVQSVVVGVLEREIKVGELVVVFPDGTERSFGPGASSSTRDDDQEDRVTSDRHQKRNGHEAAVTADDLETALQATSKSSNSASNKKKNPPHVVGARDRAQSEVSISTVTSSVGPSGVALTSDAEDEDEEEDDDDEVDGDGRRYSAASGSTATPATGRSSLLAPTPPDADANNGVSGGGDIEARRAKSSSDAAAAAAADVARGSFRHRTSIPRVRVRVLSSNFYLRLLLSGDLGFAEAYMAGEVEIETIEGGGQRLRREYYGEDIDGEEDVSGTESGDALGLTGRGGNAAKSGATKSNKPRRRNLHAVKEREGEGLLDLFQIAIRSDHPAAASSLSGSAALRRKTSTIRGSFQSSVGGLLSALASATTNSRIVNSVRNSVGNIRAHYDISNRMFASFLSAEMTYSCAIFPELDGDLYREGEERALMSGGGDGTKDERSATPTWSRGSSSSRTTADDDEQDDDELELAQMAKLRHMIRKAKIKAGHRVLEIGSGWGSFAMEAVRMTGCTVDTLTLSAQQKVLAEERIRKAGLQDSIRVHLMDFRELPVEWYHTFDRLVSIEMLEAVGKEYIEPYFKMIDDALNEQGVAVFQVITIPESRFEAYSKSNDFIRKWIFPGGFLPSVAFTSECILRGAQGRLVVDSICNIGPHYARTLREWRIRFLRNFDRDIVPALKDEHPEMSDEDIQVFKRKWIYYL